MSLLPLPESARATFKGFHITPMPGRNYQNIPCDKRLCDVVATDDIEVGENRYAWLCGKHYLMAYWAMACEMGVDNPWELINSIARFEHVDGVAWMEFMEPQPPRESMLPEQFRCLACGGTLIKGPGLTGPVYFHNCIHIKAGQSPTP